MGRTGDGGETLVTGLPRYTPMLAAAGQLPGDDERWAYEVKFDGIRALGYLDEQVRLVSRNGNDITPAWPEFAEMGPVAPGFVVDGEIVTFSPDGRTSFEALQSRMHQRNAAQIRSLVDAVPATYLIFDLLHIGTRSLIDLPYVQRRELLEQIGLAGRSWRVPPRLLGPGAEVLAESERLGLEGIICKRLDSPYLPGRRSPLWTKLKNIRTREVIIAGWKPGGGRRTGQIGSLIMAAHTPSGDLVYLGNVGTGFTRSTLDDLMSRLTPLQRATATVLADVPDAVWVEPRLVGEVTFTDQTSEGRLRHPSWRGLRPDKSPDSVDLPLSDA
ncbi:non-homologous end-joining DNA ligase [Nocardia sp. NBC_00511]|uniref:non-homologous end-joining DNA ligase n=1 Tax=Nocardia sp. NBC_00511 TaxID=2903591 RepID=UPI0030E1CAAD